MKRTGTVLLVLVLCVLLLSGCGRIGASDGSWRKVSDAGVLKVGIYESRFPMCTPTGNKCEGYDADFMSELASRLGIKITYVNIAQSGKTVEQLMASGTIDCAIGGIEYSSELERKFLMSERYLSDAHVIVLPQSSAITDLADMAGKIVSVAKASTSMDALRKSPLLKESFAQLNECGNDVEALMGLTDRTAEAVITRQTVAAYFAANVQPVKLLQTENETNETLATMEYVVLLPLNSVSLQEKINETYETMKRDNVPQQLYQRWFIEKQQAVSSDALSETGEMN